MEIAMHPKECVICDGTIPEHRLGSDYCSAHCWAVHHDAEFDGNEKEECDDE